jgi:hypothetical protein
MATIGFIAEYSQVNAVESEIAAKISELSKKGKEGIAIDADRHSIWVNMFNKNSL